MSTQSNASQKTNLQLDTQAPRTSQDEGGSNGRRRSSIERYQDFMKVKGAHVDNAAKSDTYSHAKDAKSAKPGVIASLWTDYVRGK